MRLSTLERVMLAALLVAAATCRSFGDDKPGPSIRLPSSKTVPVEQTPVSELDSPQLFVLQADVACRVIASRAGHLKITAASGPLAIYATFVDATAPGESELRTYDAKFLWLIRAGLPGEVELIVAPRDSQVTDDSDVIRRTLIVGHGPRPPPDPDPKPDPTPDPEPKPPPVADRVLGLIVFSDLATRSPESAVLLTSRYWQTLSDRHRVAVYLRSTNERVGKAFLSEIGNQTGDMLLIRDDAKSAKLEAIPLPKNQAEFERSLKNWSAR